MKKILVIASTLILSASSVLADKIFESIAEKPRNDIKVVFGEGRGVTEEVALMNAIRDAVQSASGLYVSSAFRKKNETILKNELISHYKAYIDHYKKVGSEVDEKGITTITIKAWVKVRDYEEAVRTLERQAHSSVDATLSGFDLTNLVSAEKLLRDELENFNPITCLMTAKFVNRTILDSDEDFVTIRYVYEVAYSPEKYIDFVYELSEVLDNIAEELSKTKTLLLDMKSDAFYPSMLNRGIWREETVTANSFAKRTQLYKKPPRTIAIVTKPILPGGFSILKEWKLSPRLYRIYAACRSECRRRADRVDAVISVYNAAGEVLETCRVALPTTWYCQGIVGDWGLDLKNVDFDFHPMICRWESTVSKKDNNMAPYFDRYVGYADICVPKMTVPEIKAIKVALEAVE